MKKKTKESITKTREHKYNKFLFNAQIKQEQQIEKIKEQAEKNIEYQIEKIKRKYQRTLAKKKLEYERKAKNEIRLLEGKPQREYKTKSRTRNHKLQFALEIAQENAKLRDTNENGNGRCISCNYQKRWEELAGGHRWSRRIQGVCLDPDNINAQCHTCNYTTGPMGDKQAEARCNITYDENAIRKYGEKRRELLRRRKDCSVVNPAETAPSEARIEDLIPQLIAENEKLRKLKNFYKPKRSWRKVREGKSRK